MIVYLNESDDHTPTKAWVDRNRAPLVVTCYGEYYSRRGDSNRYYKSIKPVGLCNVPTAKPTGD